MDYIRNPHDAELIAAETMRNWGYLDAVASPVGADGGIDVHSRHAIAQVKWKGAVVGRPDCQRLVGARGTDTSKALLFFAASGYSKGAIEYADQVGMSLFTYDPTGRVHAVNRQGVVQIEHPLQGHSWHSTDWDKLLYLLRLMYRLLYGSQNNARRRSRRHAAH